MAENNGDYTMTTNGFEEPFAAGAQFQGNDFTADRSNIDGNIDFHAFLNLSDEQETLVSPFHASDISL